MADFYQYFIEPILSNGWFNPVNTIAYSLILVISVYFVFRLLKKMNIHIDKYFFYAVLPFVFWASSTRVLHDAAFAGALPPGLQEFYNLPIFPTPGSYLITFMFALLSLLLGLLLQKYKKIAYWKTMLVIGTAASLLNVILLPWQSIEPLLVIGGLTLAWTGLFLLIDKVHLKIRRKNFPGLGKENLGILGAHFLDASATFASLSFYGYVEQHVVPRLFFPIFGPISMFFLKIIVVITVLYLIDRYGGKDDFSRFLKIVVLILGLAPGLRDLLRVMVGV